MNYKLIANKYKVSCVGIGGHFSKMEEGEYELRYTEINPAEIARRTELIEKAVDHGITYFDTTWRNEVDMLARSIEPLNIRDSIYINGMVLGAFAGSKAMGMDVCDYFDKWLDERLRSIPGHRFDSFMINAIEESYDEESCEKLIRHMERRRQNGDFNVIGFSCHDHALARKIADRFEEFEVIMLAYNYSNRKLEKEFEGYKGKASLVAMKPLVWAEYGIPFCAVNDLPHPSSVLGKAPKEDIAVDAIRWLVAHGSINCVVSALNSENELNQLLAAGSSQDNSFDDELLSAYRDASQAHNGIPFFLGAAAGEDANRRRRFFALSNLARALRFPYPELPLNAANSDGLLAEFKEKLLSEATKQGFKEFI